MTPFLLKVWNRKISFRKITRDFVSFMIIRLYTHLKSLRFSYILATLHTRH